MFGRKNKNQISADYFARVDDNQLNFDDDLIQSIAEKTGSLATTWPNVSLGDLQTFLSQLEQDIVRASDRDLRIGTVTYFQKNGNGKAEPSGLSWEDAVLTAGFENIVVSTAEHIFNSPAVRQDEQTDYEVILDALNPLIEAALETTDLTPQDMPVFPDAEAYRQARETDNPLEIAAEKFQPVATPVVSVLTTSTTFKPETVEETDHVEERQSQDIPVVPELKQEPVASNDKKAQEVVTLGSRPEQQLIDRISITATPFPVEGGVKEVPAESEAFVTTRLNQERQKANIFLTETSQLYTQKVRRTLAEALKKQQADLAVAVAQVRDTDITQRLQAQIDEERPSEYQERYDLRQKARESGYDKELNEENQRHQATVENLKDSYLRDLEDLKVSVNQELDDWYLQRTQELSQTLQHSVDQEVETLTKDSHDTMLTDLEILRDDLLTEHKQSLLDLQEKLAKDLAVKQAQFQKEHQTALVTATELAAAKTHVANLGDLEQQIQVLKTTNGELEQKLKLKDQAADGELAQLKQQIDRLQMTSTPGQKDDINQQLMLLLESQLKSQQPPVADTTPQKSGTSALGAFAIGSMAALIIGGIGFAGYAYGHQSIQPTAKQSKSSSQQSTDKTISLAPQSTGSSQASSDQSKATSTSQSSTESQASSQSSSQTSQLSDRYHVGETVVATINDQTVNATVKSVQDKSITVFYDGYDYVVPIAS